MSEEYTVFISSTTAELGKARKAAHVYLEGLGLKVLSQSDEYDRPDGGAHIVDMIHSAHLVIALVSTKSGDVLSKSKVVFPQEGSPEAALVAGFAADFNKRSPKKTAADLSWTQFERELAAYLVRRDHRREPGHRPTYYGDARKLWTLVLSDKGKIMDPEQAEYRAWLNVIDENPSVHGINRSTREIEDVFFRHKLEQDEFDHIDSWLRTHLEEATGFLPTLRRIAWTEAKRRAAAYLKSDWDSRFVDAENHGGAREPRMPFIKNQTFIQYQPKTGSNTLVRHLTSAMFRPGRNTEAAAADISRVQSEEIERPDYYGGPEGETDARSAQRICVIAAAGMGKTITTIHAAVSFNTHAGWANARTTPARFALRIEASLLLRPEKKNTVMERMARAILKPDKNSSELKVEGLFRKLLWNEDAPSKACIEMLEQDRNAGRLMLVVDALDQVGGKSISYLHSLAALHGPWKKCDLLIAGRPEAIQAHWHDEETGSESDETISREGWRFISPGPFTRAQVETIVGAGAFRILRDGLGDLCYVPRVLAIARRISLVRLSGLRTQAELYTEAVEHMLNEELIRLKVDAESRNTQKTRLMKTLSAIAFLTRFSNTDDPAYDFLRIILDEDVRGELRTMVATENSGIKQEHMDDLLFQAQSMSSIVDAEIAGLAWSSMTLMDYFAARWLAQFATAAHSVRMSEAIYYSDVKITERFRELNLFLAEMPPNARTDRVWVASASAWYAPRLADGRRRGRWPAEMLFRSWPSMHQIARLPVDDWWDAPYCTMGDNMQLRKIPIATDFKSARRDGPERAARDSLYTFMSDFEALAKPGEMESIAAGEATERAAAIGEIKNGWRAVPDGEFVMGSDPEKQGFPKKSKAYWRFHLNRLITGEVDTNALAEELTPARWFVGGGAVGAQLRKDDVFWLRSKLEPIAVAAESWRDATASEKQAAEQTLAYSLAKASELIELRWRKKDETPKENPQRVSSFDMHEIPARRSWFYLFSPGHATTIRNCLDAAATDTAGLTDRNWIHDANASHPVILVSWFDAWAFCQWTTWKERVGGKNVRYGLRLPHEPEWEFAARHHRDATGNPVLIPAQQRFWWGNDFYPSEKHLSDKELDAIVKKTLLDENDIARLQPLADENEGSNLDDREKRAHANGAPGHTRDPADAAPNGLGFKDMLGNVWEWQANIYDPRHEQDVAESPMPVQYSRYEPEKPVFVLRQRSLRGGLWYYLDHIATVANRYRLTPDDIDYKKGFRVVREKRPLLPGDE